MGAAFLGVNSDELKLSPDTFNEIVQAVKTTQWSFSDSQQKLKAEKAYFRSISQLITTECSVRASLSMDSRLTESILLYTSVLHVRNRGPVSLRFAYKGTAGICEFLESRKYEQRTLWLSAPIRTSMNSSVVIFRTSQPEEELKTGHRTSSRIITSQL
jgi:hypothetical protein